MLFTENYLSIKQPVEGIFKDKGSKFMAFAYPVKTESEIKDYLKLLKSEHPKASHFCWAYRLSPDKSIFRIDDDGEPSGTAGRQILNTILSLQLTDLLVVVVRYFGGTLLGIPGLIYAYKNSSLEALQRAAIVEKVVTDVYKLSFDYSNMNPVMKLVKEEGLKADLIRCEVTCGLELEVPKSRLETVLKKFEDLNGIQLTYIQTK